MMLMTMLIVSQVCEATISKDTSTIQYCNDCEMKCKERCVYFECIKLCMSEKCRCCVTHSPACV